MWGSFEEVIIGAAKAVPVKARISVREIKHNGGITRLRMRSKVKRQSGKNT